MTRRARALPLAALLIVACGDDGASTPDISADSDASETTAPDSRDDTTTPPDDTTEPDTTEPDTAAPDTADTAAPDTPDTTPADPWATLVARYDRLETVAGRGVQRDEGNEWLAVYELR